MFSTQKKKQHNKRPLSQLFESNADFVIGENNHEAQTDSRTNTVDGDIPLISTSNPTQVSGSQVDMDTLI